jgi:putative inorganic carbon (HCO3(-)) transporter
MRDYVLAGFLFGSIPFILWRPAIGVFFWVWLSVMNPHRLAWDFASQFRWAYIIAIATLAGMLFDRSPKRLPLTQVTTVLALLVLWMTLTTIFAMDRDVSLEPWKQVIKIQLMVFAAMYLLNSKQHIEVLVWILAGSVAFWGVKGGLFTLRTGGQERVWGPAGSFIEDNNALALATIMTVPLLYYIFMQTTRRWLRCGLLAAMALCSLSVLGSQSRGGFLAIMAMLGFLWWKSRSKAATGLLLILLVPVAIAFMPQKWADRMATIETYEQDGSAMSRINSWTAATNLAKDRLFGGGFHAHYAAEFARYAEDPSGIRPAHSIYFEMLGEHGFIGLGLFLFLWILVWRDASWIIRHSRSDKDLRWASDLARMIQVSMVGYAVGGAFLNLAQYDVPYNLLAALVLTRVLVEREIRGLNQEQAVPMRAQMDASAHGFPGKH